MFLRHLIGEVFPFTGVVPEVVEREVAVLVVFLELENADAIRLDRTGAEERISLLLGIAITF